MQMLLHARWTVLDQPVTLIKPFLVFCGAVVFCGLSGCTVKPHDEIGLVPAGLVLVEFYPHASYVWEFDGKKASKHEYRSHCRPPIIVWYERLGCFEQGRVLVANLEGTVLASQEIPANARAASLAPNSGEKVAYWGVGPAGDDSLFVTIADKTTRVFDSTRRNVDLPVHQPVFWNSKGDQLYFASGETIWSYELGGDDGNKLESLAAGTNPAVSPNDEELLFRNASGGLSILTIATRAVRSLATGKVGWGGRWSSDGNFVFFALESRPISLVLLNLSTGKSQSVSFAGVEEDLPVDRMALMRKPNPRLH